MIISGDTLTINSIASSFKISDLEDKPFITTHSEFSPGFHSEISQTMGALAKAKYQLKNLPKAHPKRKNLKNKIEDLTRKRNRLIGKITKKSDLYATAQMIKTILPLVEPLAQRRTRVDLSGVQENLEEYVELFGNEDMDLNSDETTKALQLVAATYQEARKANLGL